MIGTGEVFADNERYETLLVSDIEYEGMFLELWDRMTGKLAIMACYSDADGSIEFTQYNPDVAPDIEKRFREEALQRLPPLPSE